MHVSTSHLPHRGNDLTISASFENPQQARDDNNHEPPTIGDLIKVQVSVFVTGDLTFQAMVLGREAMSGQHCMLCQLS